MARAHAPFAGDQEELVAIPADAFTYEGFRRWVESDDFPETGRIDFLAGRVEVDMSPEEPRSHSVVKVAVSKTLQILVSEQDRGEVYSDRTRLTNPRAGLSAEPDILVVLWDSFDSGRVRYLQAQQSPDLVPTIDGTPDLVIEVVSKSSVRKDTVLFPPLYAKAEIPEHWLVDAREELRFEIFTLRGGTYTAAPPDSEGWIASPVLGCHFRLVRLRTRGATWRYVLEHKL